MSELPLNAIFAPRSVAIVGASRDPASLSAGVVRNLLSAGFRGPIYPVNPSARHVLSVPAWASIEALPEVPDLAVVLVPAALVLPAVHACGRAGVGAVAVLTAGFAEVPGGADLQRALVEVAAAHSMRLVGPNCLGVLSTAEDVRLNATFAPTMPPPGNVAFMTQSGALGVAILDTAAALGLGISEFASVGNKADVSGNDLIERWEHDPRTKVILLYLESFGNPRRFAQIARRVSRSKPIVAMKAGRTASGARAAASHTAAMADTDRTIQAVLDHTGVIRVSTVEELFETASLLATQPLPASNRVAIVSNAGGPGVLATDACASRGLELARLSPETTRRLRSALPSEASVTNPVDMIAAADSDTIGACLDAVLADPEVDAVLTLYVPPITADTEAVARAVVRAATCATSKPVAACFMGAHGVPAARHALERGGVPAYAFPEAGARALAHAATHARWRHESEHDGPPKRAPSRIASRPAVSVTQAADGWLDPVPLAALLRRFEVPLVTERVVSYVTEAVKAAAAIEGPVVLKVLAEGVVHKSDRGGVLLDLDGANAVADGFTTLKSRFGDAFRGAIVQPFVRGEVEIIVGGVNDPRAGPLVMFGLGGVAAEVLDDTALQPAPLSEEAAERLIDRSRAAHLLAGHRGRPPCDRAAVRTLLQDVGALLTAHPEVRELDLNPVLVQPDGEGLMVVDARACIQRGRPPR